LSAKLNTYKLKEQTAIDNACRAILKKFNAGDFFEL
jgi:hypothetical protein